MSSRIARKPITLPKDVKVTLNNNVIKVAGKHGELDLELFDKIAVEISESELQVSANDDSLKAMSGTTRALLQNMVTGVSEKFSKKLLLQGVGYRAQAKGKVLNLTLGFSHPVNFEVPEGITIETPSQTEILVSGIDKQRVGQIAADIRAYRQPEPYKGKGIRYADETVKLKETKK